MLAHAVANRLFNTLAHHFAWPRMQQDIIEYVKECHQCQQGKNGMKGYGKIALKDINSVQGNRYVLISKVPVLKL